MIIGGSIGWVCGWLWEAVAAGEPFDLDVSLAPVYTIAAELAPTYTIAVTLSAEP